MMSPALEQVLSKAEYIFAAIWNKGSESISTEAIASYYEVNTGEVLDILQSHFAEFNLNNDEWNPKDAIRLGFLLDSPIAAQVRSLALDLVEAHKCKSKKEVVTHLLQNAEMVQWSNREIARIANCSHTSVNRVRQELELSGNVVKSEKRKFNRNGTVIEQTPTKESLSQPTSGNLFPDKTTKAKVISPLHFRYEQEGEIDGEPPNRWQQIVKFPDGSREAIANQDLDAPSTPITRKVPRQYQEAIAQMEEQHRAEIQQLEQRLMAGIKSKAEELAQESVRERIAALEAIASQKSAEAAKLQQQVMELESLRSLESENRHLNQRVTELQEALASRPQLQNHNFTSAAKRVLNSQVSQLLQKVEELEPELHLRILAQDAPSNPAEALQLIGRSLANFDSEKAQKASSILLEELT